MEVFNLRLEKKLLFSRVYLNRKFKYNTLLSLLAVKVDVDRCMFPLSGMTFRKHERFPTLFVPALVGDKTVKEG